jgi:hypothetical protein
MIWLAIIVGIAIGWALRSIQFAWDEECCDPDHKDHDHEP